MNDFLRTPIEYLKGVGPQRAELLRQELGISSFNDLLHYFPFRYIDRSKYFSIADLVNLDNYVQLKGRIIQISESKIGRQTRLIAKFQDHSGVIDLVWFQGAKWIKPILKTGVEYQIFGKAKMYGNNWNIPHPEITEWKDVHLKSGLQPVYSSTEKLNTSGLNSKGIEKITNHLVELIKNKIPENLPQKTLSSLSLFDKEKALYLVHRPNTESDYIKARLRLKFEELFFLQIELLLKKEINFVKNKGYVFSEIGSTFNDFYNHYLPFELTGAQKRVLKEIRKDVLSGHHMNRLLQGDVGSGKTLIALLSMLMAKGNNFQSALMAPTEILAKQHFETIQTFLKDLPINIVLLTGSTKKKERLIIADGLENGTIDMIVGTHALIEDHVKFLNLGLVVIDEQHRFGVAQRAKLRLKNQLEAHVLVMTATPIPRTLAMTLYGDLEVSVIDELPPGRKPIETYHRKESSRLRIFGFLKEQIALGRQVYIVYPLIQESETLDYNNLMSGFEAISRSFPLPQYKISMVHGKMKPEVKDFEMQRFVKGETQIMIATTVIEVGVNVPNASVMLIESAERFGLSQLHQLRGRVGRGAEKSYCILMTGDKVSKESIKRMETMENSSDGFEIAEVDLKLRGPGDLMGTQQSGMLQLKIADLTKDQELVVMAREHAKKILEVDPRLSLPENAIVRVFVEPAFKNKPNWGKIG